jgi:hypothetical protein
MAHTQVACSYAASSTDEACSIRWDGARELRAFHNLSTAEFCDMYFNLTLYCHCEGWFRNKNNRIKSREN